MGYPGLAGVGPLCCCCLVAQWCPTLGDPMNCSLPGSSDGILQEEHWRGLPFPPPGDLPDLEIESESLRLLHCKWILYG